MWTEWRRITPPFTVLPPANSVNEPLKRLAECSGRTSGNVRRHRSPIAYTVIDMTWNSFKLGSGQQEVRWTIRA